MQALTDQEQKFALYTGARCPQQKREAIIELLGDGRKIDDVRRLVNVHDQTVRNVANEFAVEIADYDRRMTAKLRRCKWALADRIEREVDYIPRQALGLTFKIVSDQEATDSGRAIARVDHVHRIDLFSDFGDFVRGLEACSVMEEKNGAEIHLGGEKKLSLPAAGADLAPIEVEAEHIPGPSLPCHWKSDVLGLPTQPGQANTPTLPTDSPAAAPDPAARAAGASEPDREGGGSRIAAPTNPTKDNGSQKFLANGL